uniref:Uncharacterized protein n=1 Tax=Physcomitrium patens TaxID=3218 RepID=A0A2K1KX02_PHYPA|nr:hypothetical protein PHYPA_005303 [Physcomitrium patens]
MIDMRISHYSYSVSQLHRRKVSLTCVYNLLKNRPSMKDIVMLSHNDKCRGIT